MPGKKAVTNKTTPTENSNGVPYKGREEILLRLFDLFSDLEEFTLRSYESDPTRTKGNTRQMVMYLDATGTDFNLRRLLEETVIPKWKERKAHSPDQAAIKKALEYFQQGVVLRGEVERILAWEHTISHEAAGAMFDGIAIGLAWQQGALGAESKVKNCVVCDRPWVPYHADRPCICSETCMAKYNEIKKDNT